MTTDDVESLAIRPSTMRIAAIGVLVGLAATFVLWVVLALVSGASSVIPGLSALGLVVAAIVTAPRIAKRGSIEIANGTVFGPTHFGGREMIRLEDIDWRRTENRTLLQRMCGIQRIYSTSTRQIIVNQWWYRPEDLWRLSEALRVRYAGVAT